MILSEFKAWFEGYTEGLEAAPTKAQFDRIKEKVKEITGTPITYPVYIDRYVQPYRPWGYPHWSLGGYSVQTFGVGATGKTPDYALTYSDNALGLQNGDTYAPFDSHAAMYELGKAEAALQ